MTGSLRVTVVLAALAWMPANARAEPLELAIVLDDSGSMLSTDPRRLSVTAAMIAVELAGDGDRVALVPLDAPRTPLAAGGARSPLLAKLPALQRRGVETIYDRPLEAARSLLARVAARRVILFLTDGEPSGRSRDPADQARLESAHEEYLRRLAGQRDRIWLYAVTLGAHVPARWHGLLARAAEASGGAAFRVHDPGELVEVFAEIYAKGLGSRVVKRELDGGRVAVAQIDPLARFANLVVIAREGAGFELRYPGGVGGGGARSAGRDQRRGHAEPSGFHFVDKIPPARLPASGELTVDLPSARRFRALLIWDYGISLELARPERGARGGHSLRAYLRDVASDGAIDRPAHYEQIKVTARLCPGPCAAARATGCRTVGELAPRCPPGSGCRYEGSLGLPGPGAYCVAAHARRSLGGAQLLDLPSRRRHPVSLAGDARLAVEGGPLRFGFDQNRGERWRDCKTLRVRALALETPATVSVDSSRLALPAGVRLVQPVPARLRPGLPLDLELCLESSQLVDRPGVVLDGGRLVLRAEPPTWFAPGAHQLEVRAGVAIVARSFWNRYRWLLLGLALGLLFLIWLVAGFVRPHAFPENLRVTWGKNMASLDRNEMPVSEVPRARRGFYRNAQLWAGGRYCFVASGSPTQGRFEATSASGISVFLESGTPLVRVNKFDPDQQQPVASGSSVGMGEVFKLGELYIRLKL